MSFYLKLFLCLSRGDGLLDGLTLVFVVRHLQCPDLAAVQLDAPSSCCVPQQWLSRLNSLQGFPGFVKALEGSQIIPSGDDICGG